MGKCILHFDRIEIIEKKDGSAPADSDWMIVHWFVGRDGRQLHVLPLANASGSARLQAGDTLRPLSLEVNCQDDDLVTAIYQIVNLGAHDALVQARLAGAIAQQSTEALTQAYVEAAEFVVENSGAPMDRVSGSGFDEVQAVIMDAIAAAFEAAIVPSLDGLPGGDAGLVGRNGRVDVLHDITVFAPAKPMPPLRAQTRSYASGCGRMWIAIHLTLERRLRAVPWLPSEPAPSNNPSRGSDQASC